ncbi:ComEC/Rec2 family competence protein [uncultured Algibacter sp.]|uniref:ComEC/Rec2 family competence protein n=1 Tax=uncultured Algibacter sp. TaxID=298659 RepID=UPI00321621A3
MSLLNFTILKLTLFLIAGIVIGHLINIPLQIILFVNGISLILLFYCYWRARNTFIKTMWFGNFAFTTMICIGVLTTTLHNQKNNSNHYTHHISNDVSSPKRSTVRIREILKSSTYQHKYVIDILQVDETKTTGKSILNIKKDSLQNLLKVDDIFIVKADFKAISMPKNPGQFDYKHYLAKQYIYHQLFETNTSILKVENNSVTLLGIANNIRQYINKKLKPYGFEPNQKSIINALLLGQRQDISKDIYSSYVNAGVIHILAVSGLHVGIILLILNFLLKPLERFKHGRLIKTLLIVSILWSFAIVAGLSASVTRAVTMFSVFAIAANLKRPTNTYNTIAISMFVILLCAPRLLFDVGFQLSYLAVIAIVSIDPFLYKLWKPKYKLVDKYWHTLTVTISAQIGIIPLSLYYFHQFPSLFFLSNLIIVPFLAIILSFGILIILLAIINILPQSLATAFGGIISIMNDFVSWVSNQDVFLIKHISFSLLYVFASYLIIISLMRLLIKRNYYNLKFVLITIITIQSILVYNKHIRHSNEFIIFHKNRFSLIGNTINNEIMVSTNSDATLSKSDIIKDYTVSKDIKIIKKTPLRNTHQFNNQSLLIVDSLGVYNVKTLKSDYILLRQSPKININRLIDSIRPQLIIADGSNYKSYVKHWEAICIKRKLPFHHTGKKGAFVIKY